MDVLLITRNFPPLRGGMERLNQRMILGLSAQGSTALVGPRGCASHAPLVAHIEEVPASPPWRFLACSMSKALRLASRCRPDVVIAGSGLTAPMAWLAARLVGARCAVYLHGLDLIVQKGVYQALWLPFIRRCDIAIANSRNTARLASVRGVERKRLHVVVPGTDLPAPRAGARMDFRSAMGLGRGPLLLSVGRLTRRKGLAEFVSQALPSILAKRPDTIMLLIGHDASDALAGPGPTSQRQRIIEAARAAGVEDALRIMPPCDDATLSDAYSAADVHVFPILDVPGDVEGFGMVAVEAAAHGLPTVAFQVGGVPDAVIQNRTGTLVSPGDYGGFAASVQSWLDADDGARAVCAHVARRFAWTRFDCEVRALLEALVGKIQ